MSRASDKAETGNREEHDRLGIHSSKDSTSTVQTEFGNGDAGNMGGMTQFALTNAKLKAAIVEDGEFIVISRRLQSEDPVIMSSGDQEQTKQLFEQVARTYAWRELTPA